MNRRDALKVLAAAPLISARSSSARAADGPSPEMVAAMKRFAELPISAKAIAPNVTMIQGPGGNMAVLAGPGGSILVDSGFAGRGKDILAAATKAGGGPVRRLINTHWHFDHAGGNAEIGGEGVEIWATPNARMRLATEQYSEFFKMTSPPTAPAGLPSLAIEGGEVHHGGEVIHLVTVPPAHTDGDLILHFKSADVIHTGDLVSIGGYPNIDASSRGWLGGMIAAVDRILSMAGPATKIIPGHGPLGSIKEVAAYRAMLGTIYDRVAPMVAKGKSIDEIVASAPTKDYDATLGHGFFDGPTFTRMVADGIARHEKGGK